MVLSKQGQMLIALGIFLASGQVPTAAQTMPPAQAPVFSTSPPYLTAQASSSGASLLPPSIFPESMTPSALPPEAFFDRRWTAPPGWFGNVETTVMYIHLENHLTGQVFLPGGTLSVFQLPTASLEVTASPRVGVGYRFAEMGEITFSYQAIVSDGDAVLRGFDPSGAPAGLRSRLNVNIADLDYAGSEICWGPTWNMKWHVGVRYANIYSDSRAAGPTLQQGVSNLFNGAGPTVGFALWRALPAPGLSAFGRLNGSFLVGPLRQTSTEAIGGAYRVNHEASGGPAQPGDMNTNTGTPMILNLEVGVGYTPPWARWVRFSGGFQFQQWFDLGSSFIPSAPGLPADVQFSTYGGFFRGEIHF